VKSLGVNLLLATVWLLLSRSPDPAVFAIGMLMGFGLLAAFPNLMDSHAYVRRTLAALRFIFVFSKEFFVANLSVARLVLFRRRENLHPNFITYDTTGMRPAEILLLSYCVSLTPGSTSVEISDDFRTLVIHALDADDPATIRQTLDQGLRRAILDFTR
jgi:multicomponent Na+:H+ antiporter subunit E